MDSIDNNTGSFNLSQVETEYKSPSDKSLEYIFKIAAKSSHIARFLRLGGPTEFRKQVIDMIDKPNTQAEAYKLLVEENISEIEFLLTNPYSEAFLTRMDEERHANWQIWRVRAQIKDFAKGLIKASTYRAPKNPIKIGFHNADLIWNVGIAEDQLIIVRAYYEQHSGHSKYIAEKRFFFGKKNRLAEAFQSYYQSVKTNINTSVVQHENELEKIGVWPSLFKANAIMSPLRLSDEEVDDAHDISQPDSKERNLIPLDCTEQCEWVEKSCENDFGKKAEEAWLSIPEKMETGQYFNPIRLCRTGRRRIPFDAKTLCMHAVEGITAAEFLWHLEQVAKLNNDLKPKLAAVSGALTYQAFEALYEFRRTSKKVHGLKANMQPYPWKHQLKSAVLEAGRFVVENKQELETFGKGAEELGAAIEDYLALPLNAYPFRDAHLKNRLIRINGKLEANNYELFQRWLLQTSAEDIFKRLQMATYDIDFETSFYKVTEWDDPFHILWSNFFGYNDRVQLVRHIDEISEWWKPVIDEKSQGLWMTLLCRSLREYCRRLWYNHVMPITYTRRYAKEKRDLFLEFARAAKTKVNGFTEVKQFIDKCYMAGDTIWTKTESKYSEELIVPEYPRFLHNRQNNHPRHSSINLPLMYPELTENTKVDPDPPLCSAGLKNVDVFLSYNSQDKPVVQEVGQALKARGLKVWLDEWDLIPGRPWQDALDEIIEKTLSVAVFVGNHGIGPWQTPEIRGCISEFVKRNMPVIPVLLPGAPVKPKLPLFLNQFTWVDLRDGLTCTGLDKIQWGVTGQKPSASP